MSACHLTTFEPLLPTNFFTPLSRSTRSISSRLTQLPKLETRRQTRNLGTEDPHSLKEYRELNITGHLSLALHVLWSVVQHVRARF
ncbi:hypothetical protein RIF29_14807 [Crotalaria pallida]|uniref:Uncharacterized protein n=1 Tax=Crotalaria pallida TaxID=3830 RepID=A0AAN9ID25_CROPI